MKQQELKSLEQSRLMKQVKQTRRSAKRLGKFRLVSITILILTMLSILACQSKSKTNEPDFVPIMYVPDIENGSCTFTNASDMGDVVSPASGKWRNMYLAPISDLSKINDKFLRCKEWQ